MCGFCMELSRSVCNVCCGYDIIVAFNYIFERKLLNSM